MTIGLFATLFTISFIYLKDFSLRL
ncbi:sortase B protein-sorting domain-containing protein [Aquiflexum balticum]